jgi:peptide/nickel transport system permease protein
MRTKTQSPGSLLFKKLLKKKAAVFGIFIISMGLVLSIFAFLFIPDKTPNANLQIPELSLKHPGFTTQILLKRKNRDIPSKNLLPSFFTGKESEFEYIPIKTYELSKTDILIEKISGTKSLYTIEDVISNTSEKTTNGADISESTLHNILKKEHIIKKTYLLGTDRYGRSVLSRLLLGIRISLFVGFIAVIISILIGVSLGAMAGYYGGRMDQIIMMLINTVWSIPTLLLVFAIVLALGKGVAIIFIAVGLTMWVEVARIVRGQVLNARENQYVQAAKSMGFGTFRIISKHILPNIIGPILVIAAANFATAILIEAGLSYLGFGIQPPTPSIGSMLNENYGYVFSGRTILAIAPALTIMLLVLSFNLVGSGLRDVFDIKKITE